MTGPLDRRDRIIRSSRYAGLSLVEVLVIISILGVILALAIPSIGNLADVASRTKAKQNALSTSSISGSLSAAGVAHVLPESMGGAEATTRLIRRGITIPDGPLIGTYFGMPNLPEHEVAPTAVYLEIVFDQSILRMVYDSEEPEP